MLTSNQALLLRASPASTPKLSKAFSLNSQETIVAKKPASQATNNGDPAEAASEEDPALFKPFSAAEDPAMYEKGTFQYLFENSQFVRAADPAEKEVEGEIVAVEGDKVYVDFGCKFHAVVSCPEAQRERCQRGGKVIIALQDLEVTKHFIGDTKHNSLLEAEAKFVRLV